MRMHVSQRLCDGIIRVCMHACAYIAPLVEQWSDGTLATCLCTISLPHVQCTTIMENCYTVNNSCGQMVAYLTSGMQDIKWITTPHHTRDHLSPKRGGVGSNIHIIEIHWYFSSQSLPSNLSMTVMAVILCGQCMA